MTVTTQCKNGYNETKVNALMTLSDFPAGLSLREWADIALCSYSYLSSKVYAWERWEYVSSRWVLPKDSGRPRKRWRLLSKGIKFITKRGEL